MGKICTICGQERDSELDFSWKYKEHGIRHTRCKYCQSQVSKKHYTNNKQAYVARARASGSIVIAENRKRLIEYLGCHPCVDCGQKDVRVLDFDHVRGKKSEHVVRLAGVGYSWSIIEAEIAKCEVRCANCHRIKTGEKVSSWRHSSESLAQLNYFDEILIGNDTRYVKNRLRLLAYLQKHPCVDCDQTDIRVLEFDHVHEKKSESITNLLKNAAPWERIEAEIAKCAVRCVNCHRIKTGERGGWWRHSLQKKEEE